MSLASFDGGFFKGVNDETNFTNEYTYYVFSQWTAAVNQWKISRTPNIRRVIFKLAHWNIRILILVDLEERQF